MKTFDNNQETASEEGEEIELGDNVVETAENIVEQRGPLTESELQRTLNSLEGHENKASAGIGSSRAASTIQKIRSDINQIESSSDGIDAGETRELIDKVSDQLADLQRTIESNRNADVEKLKQENTELRQKTSEIESRIESIDNKLGEIDKLDVLDEKIKRIQSERDSASSVVKKVNSLHQKFSDINEAEDIVEQLRSDIENKPDKTEINKKLRSKASSEKVDELESEISSKISEDQAVEIKSGMAQLESEFSSRFNDLEDRMREEISQIETRVSRLEQAPENENERHKDLFSNLQDRSNTERNLSSHGQPSQGSLENEIRSLQSRLDRMEDSSENSGSDVTVVN